MKATSALLIATLVVIILVLVLFWNKAQAMFPAVKPKTTTQPAAQQKTTTGTTSTPAIGSGLIVNGLDYNKVLQQGSSGPEVQQLQAWINASINTQPENTTAQISTDGVYGPATEHAIAAVYVQWGMSYSEMGDTVTLSTFYNYMQEYNVQQTGNWVYPSTGAVTEGQVFDYSFSN